MMCVGPSDGVRVASGQAPPTTAGQLLPDAPAATQADLQIPVDIGARLRVLEDSASLAMRQIGQAAELEGLRELLAGAETRQRELTAFFQAIGRMEYARPDRLLRLRDRALVQEQRMEQLSESVADRLRTLGALRSEWLARLGGWTAWREGAANRPELTAQIIEIEQGIAATEEVIASFPDPIAEAAALDNEVQRLRMENREFLERITALRAGRRDALLRADQPILFSAEHLRSLAETGEWDPAGTLEPAALAAFLRENGGLLLSHFVLVLALALLGRRILPHTLPEGGWSRLLHHHWALAFFMANAILGVRYLLAPPLWDVVIWSLVAGSGGVLAGTLLRGPALRLMVASVASVYPLMLLAEALRLPTPVFRIGLAAAAATAAIGFPLLALRSDPARPTAQRARYVLGITTALSVAVLATQLAGFDQLSRWLVHATLTSAYVILTVALLVVLARGALRTLLRREFVGRAHFIGSIAVPLAERLIVLLQVALILGGALVLLDVWELAASPAETWNRIIYTGFDFAGFRITLGRILFAAFLVYLAVLASWLARTVVTSEISRGWGFERGVLESINSLVHYVVITLGVLLALGALGVKLQNFAIVAGALGVGIGFGLQNVVNNFVSGLILLFERPVRVGDTVEIDGEWGVIKKIGLRSTVVVTFSQAELIVPNGNLVSEKVTNWTLSNPVTRLTIPVGVAYGTDVQATLQILVAAASTPPEVASEPAPLALFTGFGDSSLDFELRIWVRDIAARHPTRSAVLTEIDRRFREAGIEIPFPQRDLHVRSVDPAIRDAIGHSPAAKPPVAQPQGPGDSGS